MNYKKDIYDILINELKQIKTNKSPKEFRTWLRIRINDFEELIKLFKDIRDL